MKTPIVTIVLLDFYDLNDLQDTFGSAETSVFLTQIARKLRELASGGGVVERLGPTTFSVLLPGQGQEKSLSALYEVLGCPCRVEIDSGCNEMILLPYIRTANAGGRHGAISGILATMCEAVETHALAWRRSEIRRYSPELASLNTKRS